ncbi:MAG: FHA domain-containing protein [Pirellulales bacterium]|nr:FHA domain-containing protein [Pirellulales bacterium]
MDVILKVLAGSKVGAKVAIKKDEFLIGRSPKCHLRSGSSSISRRHCSVIRRDAKVLIKDLGSRNGTIVNGKEINAGVEFELASGDEIGIGSLLFLMTISHGIKNLKNSQVKSVAEAVDRTAKQTTETFAEKDISNWLDSQPDTDSQGALETQTIDIDDTNTVQVTESDEKSPPPPDDKATPDDSEMAVDVVEESAHKSVKGKKKSPGKLPPVPTEPASKDSREAAMQALRNWNRRR